MFLIIVSANRRRHYIAFYGRPVRKVTHSLKLINDLKPRTNNEGPVCNTIQILSTNRNIDFLKYHTSPLSRIYDWTSRIEVECVNYSVKHYNVTPNCCVLLYSSPLWCLVLITNQPFSITAHCVAVWRYRLRIRQDNKCEICYIKISYHNAMWLLRCTSKFRTIHLLAWLPRHLFGK